MFYVAYRRFVEFADEMDKMLWTENEDDIELTINQNQTSFLFLLNISLLYGLFCIDSIRKI